MTRDQLENVIVEITHATCWIAADTASSQDITDILAIQGWHIVHVDSRNVDRKAFHDRLGLAIGAPQWYVSTPQIPCPPMASVMEWVHEELRQPRIAVFLDFGETLPYGGFELEWAELLRTSAFLRSATLRTQARADYRFCALVRAPREFGAMLNFGKSISVAMIHPFEDLCDY